jgi:hypothetical protein
MLVIQTDFSYILEPLADVKSSGGTVFECLGTNETAVLFGFRHFSRSSIVKSSIMEPLENIMDGTSRDI